MPCLKRADAADHWHEPSFAILPAVLRREPLPAPFLAKVQLEQAQGTVLLLLLLVEQGAFDEAGQLQSKDLLVRANQMNLAGKAFVSAAEVTASYVQGAAELPLREIFAAFAVAVAVAVAAVAAVAAAGAAAADDAADVAAFAALFV